jgi:membrane protein implicated in regulation of membrane protease activity
MGNEFPLEELVKAILNLMGKGTGGIIGSIIVSIITAYLWSRWRHAKKEAAKEETEKQQEGDKAQTPPENEKIEDPWKQGESNVEKEREADHAENPKPKPRRPTPPTGQ